MSKLLLPLVLALLALVLASPSSARVLENRVGGQKSANPEVIGAKVDVSPGARRGNHDSRTELASGCHIAPKALARICFTPGTQVLMADGTTKAIEDIEIGEWVLADDPVDDAPPAAYRVVDTHETATYRIFKIFVDGGPSAFVESTGRHPFWTQRGWVAAEELIESDVLVDAAGQPVEITAIAVESRDTPTYNLSVESVSTFYVVAGDVPLLVHNVDPWDIFFTQESFGSTFTNGPLAGQTLESVAAEARALGRLPNGLTLNAVRMADGSWATLNNRTLAVARMANLPNVNPIDAGAKGTNKLVQLLRNSGLSGPVKDAVMRCK